MALAKFGAQVPVKPVKFNDLSPELVVIVSAYVPVVTLKLNALACVKDVAVTVVAVAELLLMFTVGVPAKLKLVPTTLNAVPEPWIVILPVPN